MSVESAQQLRKQQRLQQRLDEYKAFINGFRDFKLYEDGQQFVLEQCKKVEGIEFHETDRGRFILHKKYKLALFERCVRSAHRREACYNNSQKEVHNSN